MRRIYSAKNKFIFALVVITFIFAFALVTIEVNEQEADALIREKILTGEQNKILLYNGENYLDYDDGRNEVLSTFCFKLDDEEITLNSSNTKISGINSLYKPGKYNCNFEVNYDGENYLLENATITLSKRTVVVNTLLNGKSELTIKEGESVTVAYDYSGAIHDDVKIESVSGITVNVLKDNVLNRPAFVESIPTGVTSKYTIVAGYADSDYYDFEYNEAYLTILPNIVTNLAEIIEGKVMVSLNGNFSITNKLEFVNVGVSSSSEDYAAVNVKIDKNYGASDLLVSNKAVGCYRINVKQNNELPNNSVPASIRLALNAEEKGHSSYSVIAFYNNGTTEVLSATCSKDDVLSFYASDMGDFVIIVPEDGIPITTYVIAIISGVVVVLLVILLVAFFRKKY